MKTSMLLTSKAKQVSSRGSPTSPAVLKPNTLLINTPRAINEASICAAFSVCLLYANGMH